MPARELRHKEETEVIARQRKTPTATEKNVQPQARSRTEPGGKNEVLPQETRLVGESAGTTKQQPSRVAKSGVREPRKQADKQAEIQPKSSKEKSAASKQGEKNEQKKDDK